MPKRACTAVVASSLTFAYLSLFASQAAAQETEQSETQTQTYSREYFDRFEPQTARDIIDRLPGFQLDEGGNQRGFGGNAGNVLIDGERPSSKTGGIVDSLSRIPADSVERVDLIRGSAGSSEAIGQAIVANVILSSVPQSGNWQLQLERAAHGKLNINGELSLSRQLGEWRTSSKISGFIERRPVTGTRISRDPTGFLVQSQLEDRPSDQRQLAVSAEAQRPAGGGTLRLNGRFSHRPDFFATERLVFNGRLPDGSPNARIDIDFVRTIDDFELGVDWARLVADSWSLKLLSLSTYRDLNQEQLLLNQDSAGTDLSGSIFAADRNSLESIFRATMRQVGTGGIRPEFGAEAAYNRLASDLSLQLFDATGSSTIGLPAASVAVEEWRGEGFANLTLPLSRKALLEVGLEAEFSSINVSGDANNSQSFFFLKPSASLRFDASRQMQISLGVRRSVGQLNFSDFAASASAADDRLIAGNPELGPDQTTRAFVAVDYRTGTATSFAIEAFHEWRRDVLEQVVLPSGGSGVANAGNGRLWGVSGSASVPLRAIIPGGLLEFEAEFRDSSFLDPVTGEERVLSSIDSPNIFVEFRQDVGSVGFAWGVSFRASTESTFFFTDEESLNRDGDHWSIFLETTKLFGIKTNLEFSGVGGQSFFRGRRFFEPDRSGVFGGSELIDTERGMFVTLTLSKQF